MTETKARPSIYFEESDFSWKYRQFMNKAMFVVSMLCLILLFIPLVSLLLEIFIKGIKGFSIVALTETGGSPLSHSTGIAHAITGTIMVTIIACFIGIPLGIIVGVFLAYYGEGPISDVLRVGIDTMVSIPTIITGVVVWALIVTTMGHFSVLSGGIALAFIMVPILAKTTEEMIRLVPFTYDEVGYSLGFTKSRNAVSIVIPLASRGIASGVLLAISRIMGETAPLLFTAFFSQAKPTTFLDPSATLPVLIYNYAISPFEYWQQLAWFAALLLILFNLTIVLFTRIFIGGKR